MNILNLKNSVKTHKFLLFLSLMLIMGFSQINSQWISNYYGNSYGDTPLSNAHGTAVCTDQYGNCYITGYVDEGSGNNVLVVKYNSETGDTAWVRSYDGSAQGDDIGNKIMTDDLGNVYVVGIVTITGKGHDVLLLKYSTDGELLFNSSISGYDIEAEDSGEKLTFDMYGNVYVTGYCTDSNQVTSIFTIKFDTEGHNVWSKIENGLENLNAKGTGIAVNNSGTNIYVIGYITSTTKGNDMVLLKYTLSGSKSYNEYFDGGENLSDRAFGIAVDEQDYIYITGYSTTAATGTEDFVLLKYNSGGTRLWAKTLDGEGSQSDRAFGIAVDVDGCIYITGHSVNSVSNNDYLTAAFNADGDLLWHKYYNGLGNGDDEASAIGIITNVNNTKSILVTGSSWGEYNNHDYVTIRYDISSGDLQNLVSYRMSSNTEDIAKDLAISDSNEAFVTGFSQLLGNSPVNMCVVSTLKFGKFEGSEIKTKNNIPSGFKLMQNYPNPFNPSTIIKFTISERSNVKMTVYDITGREVNVLVNQTLEAGTYDITYVTHNLSSGVYFYEVRAGAYRDVKKMTFIK